jgi:uncharacterized membrane protein YfcA
MIALTVLLAVPVGISLGLLGGGGSILTVPLLAYVGGVETKHAIAMSLLVVGVTSTISALAHARAGRVQWPVVAVFGPAAMIGAYTGGRLARFVPGSVLLIAFAGIMITAGVAMLRGRKDSCDRGRGAVPLLKISLLGVAVGVISGLLGAGGGFLLVPALTLFAGLPMPLAVGTSLAVIAMQSFAGLAGHLSNEHLDWPLAWSIAAAAVIGALFGGKLIHRVKPATLRQGFGWIVLATAALVLSKEVHPAVGAAVAGLTGIAGAMVLACVRFAVCPLRRLSQYPATRRRHDITPIPRRVI